MRNPRGNLTQEVGPSRPLGAQSPLTHKCRFWQVEVLLSGASRMAECMGVTFQWGEEIRRITVNIRSLE